MSLAAASRNFRWRRAMALRFVAVAVLLLPPLALGEPSANETAARIWFEEFDRQLGQDKTLVVEASWNQAINITAENGQKLLAAMLRRTEALKAKRAEMRRLFAWQNFTDGNLTRLFDKADDIGISAASASMQRTYGVLASALTAAYSTAKVRHPVYGNLIPLDPDITKEMADPRQSEPVKRALWQRWRDATGRRMKQNYAEFVSVSNAMIREAGYTSTAAYWQSWYEPKPGQDFERSMENLWIRVKPFYQQLHAYVRGRLRLKHGAALFPPSGQIPAHILGNMWAQSWQDVLELTVPYPELKAVDTTQQMLKQGWNVTKMLRVSEQFFTSLGLDPMTDTFWQKSVFQRRPNVEMVCHASAWDFFTGRGDFRIKQCTSINMDYLGTVHHEMGHIQYYQQYERLPVLYRRGANPGFHEAVGDTLELAVLTPDHLVTIGLLNGTMESPEYYLNYLFEIALQKVAFLPFGYLIDRWRWRAFDGTIGPEKYNEYWWQLRCGLQGVSSPVRRTAEDFDPGAKHHVPSNTPYIRYFVSHLLQFQLYETLCNLSGHAGPLYRCDFYGNKVAGAALKRMLSRGSSVHWEEVLFEIAGTREISVEPLLRYFEQLIGFLQAENAKSGERIGWDDGCPDEDWYNSVSSASEQPGWHLGIIIALTAFGFFKSRLW